jgi:hypothetical protein
MRIIVDVNHPGHVHFFKNCIWELQKKGHEILITASEKDVTFNLLDNYGFEYVNLGSYGNSVFEKMLNIPLMDFKMYREVRKLNPDLVIGLSSIRGSHAARLAGKKSIIFDDTEHSKYEHLLYVPFADKILTPSCFTKDLGKKQVRYDGYHELAYLHPNYFSPNPHVLDEIGLTENDNFVIVRFVSWGAGHDVGHHGIQNKIEFLQELEKYAHVLITSEADLGKDFEKYKMKISPEKLHDLLYYATLYIGEGATTASECAILGTHAIYVNTLRLGYTDEEENKYDLVYNFSNSESMEKDSFNKAIGLLQNQNLREEGKLKRQELLKDKIDVTKFILKSLDNLFDTL